MDIFNQTSGEKDRATIGAMLDLRNSLYLKGTFMTKLEEEFLNKNTFIDLSAKMLLHQFHPSFEELAMVMVVSVASMLLFLFFSSESEDSGLV